MIKDAIHQEIKKLLPEGSPDFVVEKSANFGDYATNAAMAGAKFAGKNPRDFADSLISELKRSEKLSSFVDRYEMAGPGFINFYLKDSVFSGHIREILSEGKNYGGSDSLSGEKVMIEYTDPNPFKEFHVGHLMTNTIGEALSRIIEADGAEVRRACYQGDVGMHVAKTIYGILIQDSGFKNAADLGKAYAFGAQAYDEHKAEIQEINKKIYDRSDEEINRIYDAGKKISLDYFETLYKKLGTKFDYYFFESETGPFGKEIVEENLGKIFHKSDGAIVFPGEDHGLHTRVFINSEGLPTYEAKELGLAKKKYDIYPYDRSIILTGNEVNDYFQVLLRAMSLVFPELEKKTKHISHGMLRLPTGKMSSRTGDVITAEKLIEALREMVFDKLAERELPDHEKGKIAEDVAIGALKYSILKQSPGKDIVFDFEKSLSFEGDSGVYLQYSYVRTQSILRKAGDAKPVADGPAELPTELEHLLFEGLPNAVRMAARELSPNYIATYLIDLCRAWNAYYENHQILENEHTEYRLALAASVGAVLKRGLTILGIPVPERM